MSAPQACAQQQVVVLGATGSVGRSTLDLIERHPERYSVTGLSGHSNSERMLALIERHKPKQVVMTDTHAYEHLAHWAQSTHSDTEILWGEDSLCALAGDSAATVVVAAIVGIAGLAPTLAAARKGKRVLLANKEALVCAGALLTKIVADNNAQLLPVDSEHSGVFQCVQGDLAARYVKRIVLTASGGPLRELQEDAFASVTPEQACAHPIWSMGPKISVDSATMMNKGLELIEAAYLFNKSVNDIETVIHPQGIVHALVEFYDGNMLAQLARPDMRSALAVGLAWPERIASGVESLDLCNMGVVEFTPPDYNKFPCLALARTALASGNDAPALLNAANEVAVSRFLDKTISFDRIPTIVETGLAASEGCAVNSLEDVLQVDHRGREIANEAVRKIKSGGAQVLIST